MANGMFDNPVNAFQQNFNQLFGQNPDAAYSYAMNSSNYDQLQPLLGNNYQSYVNQYNTNQGTMGSSVLNGNQFMYQGADGQTHTYWMGNDASQGWLGLNGAQWGNTLGGTWNTGTNPFQAYTDASGVANPSFAPQALDYGDVTPTATPGNSSSVATDASSGLVNGGFINMDSQSGSPPVVTDPPAPGTTTTTTPPPVNSGNIGYDANGGYKGGDTAAAGAAPPAVVSAPTVNNGGYTYTPPTTNFDFNDASQAGGHTWQGVYDSLAGTTGVPSTNFNSLQNAIAADKPGLANNWVLRPPTAETAATAAALSSGFGNLPTMQQGGATGQGLSSFNPSVVPPVTASADAFKEWGQQKYGPSYATNPEYIRLANEHYQAGKPQKHIFGGANQ